jgi:glutamate/tyrosine decarboxylase-like PLP-dependent enzyme
VLRAHGVEAIGANVDLGVSLARDLAGRVAADPRLETLGDGGLNIVCFRYVGRLAPEALDAANREIVRRLHQEGRVAPSTTRINGVAAIRAAFFNPRSGASDVEALLEGVLRLGAGIETRG